MYISIHKYIHFYASKAFYCLEVQSQRFTTGKLSSCYICILSRSTQTEVFLKKVFLIISQNLQENTCTGISFLITASKFINEETPAQFFPKPSTFFAKRSTVDVRLGYKYPSVLLPDLKPNYEHPCPQCIFLL